MADEITYQTRLLDEKLADLDSQIPSVEIDRDRMIDYICVLVNPDDLMQVMETIANWDVIPMNYLRCLTAVDQLTHIEVVYFFVNIPNQVKLSVATRCPREDGSLPSVVGIWDTADYQEREVFEFFGVKFEGHPDLRRLLTSEKMKGYPLLKDYPMGGDPDDLRALDAFLPDGWIEKVEEEKEQLKQWLEDEIKKRTGEEEKPKKTPEKPE